MLFELLSTLDKKKHFKTVSAHCDIPCKIYDPISAQLAVMTMLRLVDLLDAINTDTRLNVNEQAQFNRLVAEKEQHGNKVKSEIAIIWGDYFKQPQLDTFPEIHQLTHSIMLAASAAKQHIDRTLVMVLLEKVNRFAEIFWQTKGITTYQAQAPYPPMEKLVYPVLQH